jgi:hypothetical protein
MRCKACRNRRWRVRNRAVIRQSETRPERSYVAGEGGYQKTAPAVDSTNLPGLVRGSTQRLYARIFGRVWSTVDFNTRGQRKHKNALNPFREGRGGNRLDHLSPGNQM